VILCVEDAMARQNQIDKSASTGVAAIVALVFWALAIGILALVFVDAYEKYALSGVTTIDLKPVIPSPRVWIDTGDSDWA